MQNFLTFEINDVHLAEYALTFSHKKPILEGEPWEHLRAFRDLAWGESAELYDWISSQNRFFYSPEYFELTKIRDLGNRLADYLEFLINSSEFMNIKSDTKNAVSKLESEWNQNFERSSIIMQRVTGLSFDESITVLVTHPSQAQGRYLRNGKIAWTHRAGWANFNTIYLWHEILHHYQPRNWAADYTCSLLADHYLKFQLNHKGNIGEFEGKPQQIEFIEETYPKLIRYLEGNQTGDINEIRTWFPDWRRSESELD